MGNFIQYDLTSNSLKVMTNDLKDIGLYPLEMCLSDGYASPTCAQFTLSVEDPIKEIKKKKEAVIVGKNYINKGEQIEQIKATIAITKINRDSTAILRVRSR